MKLLLDTSVWIEHLRRGSLAPLLPRLRGRWQLWMSGVVGAELVAGCRSRIERRAIEDLIKPFRRAGRLSACSASDAIDAGTAISRLRERGVLLKGSRGAVLDALIAVDAVRRGARLLTVNIGDFAKLAEVLPLRVESLEEFEQRVGNV